MALLTKAPRGTADILPAESYKWQHIESVLMDTAGVFGFKEIRVPVFEHTELFLRSVGDTTDVVQKEMYTFEDKGNRSITLRPEGTAGVARAILEHGLYNDALPLKVCYAASCYRYEKPQAGRLREFHQFGIEMFGAAEASADAEIILLAYNALNMLGVRHVDLQLNSIGCPQCRARYHEALTAYFSKQSGSLCSTCNDRLSRNPMRILDCKSPACAEIAKDAPTVLEFICRDCADHFEGVKGYLATAGVAFTVNPRIVRGLDYYTRTVFEFISTEIGSQGTVCGGGRYDGLTEALGGPKLPSLGFGMGLERLLMVMDRQGIEIPQPKKCEVYVASMGPEALREAFFIVAKLREEGFMAECDVTGRSLKAQMKYANKIGAHHTIVIGEDEIAKGIANLKDMQEGKTTEIPLGDGLIEAVYHSQLNREMQSILSENTIDMSAMMGGNDK